MTKFGFVVDYGHGFDLNPFPIIPAGAMYLHDNYVVANCLHILSQFGATTAIVATEIGAAYLSDAISHYEAYKKLDFLHLPEIDPMGSGNLIKQGIVSAINDCTEPIAVVPSNIICNIDFKLVEEFHSACNRPVVTVVAIKGENLTKVGLPLGYRPTELMIIERSFIKYGLPYPTDKKQSLMDVLASVEEKGKMAYYCFDGLFYEVNSPDSYLALQKDN
jgi:NDP-sugar pyrophosphorylase family protein